MKLIQKPWFHACIIIVGIIIDQAAKLWAVARLADTNGTPTGDSVPVIGNLLRFKLAYNEGAAFSFRPQDLISFLNPTIFYVVIAAIAISGLFYFYKTIVIEDWPSKVGLVIILSGALGNLIDRFRIGKVVDFIDSDFPDFIMYRWPTFNIADSLILCGVALVLIGTKLFKIKLPETKQIKEK